MATLNLRGVEKSFGDLEVLVGVDLSVTDRELVAVLGASGSGKSTLLRLIAGFEKPTAGTIELAGNEISSVTKVLVPEKRNIGIVPQDSALFPHLSASQNIGFGLAGWSSKVRAARVTELLEIVELTEFADARPEKLSGGQAQRVALARALAPRPAIILMDEPFSALDAELRTRLRLDVKAILKKERATAILVTHDQEEALSLADRVAVLRNGQIVQVGSPTEIYNSPVDIGIATFLGDAVLIDGEVKNGKILTSLGFLNPLNKVTEGQTGRVAIRGENFYLLPNPKGDGEVIGQIFFGHDAVVEVVTRGVKIRARSNGPFAPEVGMKVSVWVRGSVNFYPA
jgi:iron(III) transport system ATP-binding protein